MGGIQCPIPLNVVATSPRTALPVVNRVGGWCPAAFIARETGSPILEHLIPEELAVSVIIIGELRSGVLAATDTGTRARRLSTLAPAAAFQPVPIDNAVAATRAKLRVTFA